MIIDNTIIGRELRKCLTKRESSEKINYQNIIKTEKAILRKVQTNENIRNESMQLAAGNHSK